MTASAYSTVTTAGFDVTSIAVVVVELPGAEAVVSSGTREQMESDVARLHAAGLWATLQQDD